MRFLDKTGLISQYELKKLLLYDSESGDFTWISGQRSGKKAGAPSSAGYWKIKINRKLYSAHRLAWLYAYGEFPPNEIDHINGARNVNKIANLRECSGSENCWNIGIRKTNTSGFKGVDWYDPGGKWRARIMIDGKRKSLGYFATAELASAAYIRRAKELHGEFYRETQQKGA